MSSLIFTAHIYHTTHVHNSLWRGNSGGQTRLYSCLVLAVNPINNIRNFFGTDPTLQLSRAPKTSDVREICWDSPDCITVSRVNNIRCKGNFWGQTRLYNCLILVVHRLNNIRYKGNFWGQTRSLALADVPADESV